MRIVFGFGRLNPPTIGHEKLVEKIKSVAAHRRAIPRLYLSHTQNSKKDPLPYNSKISYARAAFGKMVITSNEKKLIGILTKFESEGVNYAVLVCGSDRVLDFRRMLNECNGRDFHIDKLEVISAGERDPDADGVTGMSASKMRSLALEGNLAGFLQGAPSGLTSMTKKKMYNEVRSNMKNNIKEESEENQMNIDEKFESMIDEEDISQQELQDVVDSMELRDLDPNEDDAYLLDVICPEAIVNEAPYEDDHEELDEARVWSVPQRIKMAQRMRRLSKRYGMLRKMKMKRMATSDRLKYRSRKAALMAIRKRVAGRLGKQYGSISRQQKVSVDQMVSRRFGKKLGARIRMFAARMLPMVRKKEVERLSRARGGKSKMQSHVTLMAGYEPQQNSKHRMELFSEARKSVSADQGDEGDNNIIYQMRKVINLHGNYDIKWRDGTKSRMTPAEASAAIKKYEETINTPGTSGREKQWFVLKLGRNLKSFNSIVGTVKNESNESAEVGENPSRLNPKIDMLMRLGLVDASKISQYRQALKSGDKALSSPQLRLKLMDILDRLIDLSTNDPQVYSRLRRTVSTDESVDESSSLNKKQEAERDSLKVRHARERVNAVTTKVRTKSLNNKKVLENLQRKSKRSGIDLDDIIEVYQRGLEAEGPNGAFDRVNSFISGGAAKDLDADLLEHPNCGTPECCGACDNISEEFNDLKTAIDYSTDKVKTHRDDLDGIEVYKHNSGKFYVNHTSNYSGRMGLRDMNAKHLGTVYKNKPHNIKENMKSSDFKMIKVRLPDGRIVMRKKKSEIRTEEKTTPLQKLKKFDALRASLGAKPIFKENEKKNRDSIKTKEKVGDNK